MIVDTDKTNCGNCKYCQEYIAPQAVLEHPQMNKENIGKLKACVGKFGFGIIGPTFYCTKHELQKGKTWNS